MIYETVWWVVVGFCFLQELCKTAKNKKVPIGKFVQKGSNPPQPTTAISKYETKSVTCSEKTKTKQKRSII